MERQIEHTEVIEGVTYTISIEQDDQPVRGNISAVGVIEDQEAENWVYAELHQGNLWAWCVVTVEASVQKDGVKFAGKEYLGGCSYENKQAFMVEGGYYPDMRDEARAALQGELLRYATRGTYALEWLDRIFDLKAVLHKNNA